MLNQQEILNKIAQCLHSSAPSEYETANLEYKIVENEEKWTSLSAGFTINGKKTPPKNFTELQDLVEPLLGDLRTVMAKETEPQWNKISLLITEERKVNVDFDYSEQQL